MHKYQNADFNIKRILDIKKLFLIILTAILYLSLSFSTSFAQSADSVTFTLNIDKTTLSPGEGFTATYKITNNSASVSLNNSNVDFNYIDKLDNTNFTGSSTGLAKDSLKANGYNISSLSPGQSLTLVFNFQTTSDIATGQAIHNSLDNSNAIKSTLTFKFSSDPNAPVFTKDATANLPTVGSPKPAVASIKYPSGITGYDLSQLDNNSVKSVKGFFLQGLNKITFTEPVDLSSTDAITVLNNINQYIDLNTKGFVSINWGVANNTSATIDFKNINFIDTPLVFFGDKKLDKTVKFDVTNKTISVDVDNAAGKFSLVGEVKATIPTEISGKFLHLEGKLSDPEAHVDVIVDGVKQPTLVADLTTGDFKFDYTFSDTGDKDLEFDVAAKNGTVNKQTYTINVTGLDATSTPTPTPQIASSNQQTYIMAFLISIGAILLLGVLLTLYLTFISLKKRKNKIGDFPSLNNEDDDEIKPVEILNIKKQTEENNLYTEASENRHEIIRDKVEKNIDNLKSTDDISEPDKQDE